MTAAQLVSPAAAQTFITAGNARLTIVSKKTGARYTYRVRRAKDAQDLFFVSVLTGSDNESDFSYLGTLARGQFFHGKKSRLSADAPSAKAWQWYWTFTAQGREAPNCETWHEGRCGRCGRPLTVPESIAAGLGPDCAGK